MSVYGRPLSFENDFHYYLRTLSIEQWLVWPPRVELSLGSSMVLAHMGGLCNCAFGLSWFRHVRIRELLLPLICLREGDVPSLAKLAPAAVAALYGLHTS